MGTFVTKEQIIEDIKRVSNILGRTPLIVEYDHLGKISSVTVRKNFGSWTSAMEQSGLTKTEKHRTFWTDEEIDGEIKRLTEMLGHRPSWRDFVNHSKISVDTIYRRTGERYVIDYDSSELPEWNINDVSPEDGHWIAGFVAGEGCFTMSGVSLGFTISQRSDEVHILEFIARTMGLPLKYIKCTSNQYRRDRGQKAGDEARLQIYHRKILKDRVLPFFDRFPLRARKEVEFKIFRNAVLLLVARDEDGSRGKRLNPKEKQLLTEWTATMHQLKHDPTSLNK